MNRLFRIPRPDLPTDLAADLPADLPCGDPVNLSRRGFLLTSAGAAARVPVARATNLVRALRDLQQAGCFVVGLDGDGTTQVGDLELADGPLVIVTGGEGKGLSRLTRETCDVIAAIPIGSAVESLNASVATSIALYEVAKRRTES